MFEPHAAAGRVPVLCAFAAGFAVAPGCSETDLNAVSGSLQASVTTRPVCERGAGSAQEAVDRSLGINTGAPMSRHERHLTSRVLPAR